MKKEVKMTEKLKKFLIKERLLTKFKRNVPKNLSGYKISGILEAFIWNNAPEGCDFWDNVSEKFEENEC